MRPLRGRLVGERYELLDEVASGGMGTVFKALDRMSGGFVAVKLLKPGSSDERFEREATMLAGVSHPAIVRYHSQGSDGPDGRDYIVTEWLEGETLEERLQRERLILREAITVTMAVAEALGAVHARGIVHRDIKPSNIFLLGGSIGCVKVLDFGLAKRSFDAQLTREGTWIGTPLYMSPEQARGDRQLDARADVYSLGSVFFECVAGAPPFRGEQERAVLAKIVLEEVPRLSEVVPDVPAEVNALVARLLDKRREARPADGNAVAAALRELQGRLRPEELTIGSVGPLARRATISMDDEVRVVCVVIVAPEHVRGDDARPMTMALERDTELSRLVEGFGAKLDYLADGTMLARPRRADAPRNQATQMARCALALRTRARNVAIVVSTGSARVGGGATLGEVLDHGAELLAVSGAGEVTIDETTAALVEPRFAMKIVDGRHILRRELDSDERPRLVSGKGTRFVGRTRELEVLEATWTECREEGVAETILVTAPAGMGKSRLWQELVRRLRDRGEAAEILVARGDALRQSSPFGMLGPALRASAGVSASDPGAAEKLRLRLGRHLAGDSRERVCTFLGELAGVPLGDDDDPTLRAARADPKIMADQMRSAWLDWLAAECRTGPVLVVGDDVHWADQPTMEFLAAAVGVLRQQPFMLAAFGRPEVRDRFPDLWARLRPTEVHLGELTKRASEALVKQVLGDAIDATVLDGILNRAQGNPFFIEELVRSTTAKARVSGSGGSKSAPETVLGLVHARLDGLGRVPKRVLRAASIFGERFSAEAVRALLGDDESALVGDTLAQLQSLEILDESGRRAREYTFRHSLLRDASYALLTDADRRLGHRLAGRWLEEKGAADPMLLLEHFERGDDLARVARWSAPATRQAMLANDLHGAITVARRGVAAGADGDVLAELQLLMAQAHRWRDEPDLGERCAREAVARLPKGSALWFEALTELHSAALHGDLHEDIRKCVEDGRQTPAQPGAELARQFFLAMGCGISILSGHYEATSALLAELGDAEVLARENPRAAVPLLHGQACHDVHRRDLQGAAAKLRRAIEMCETIGDHLSGSNLRSQLGSVLSWLGQFEEAETALAQARAIAERLAADYLIATARTGEVWVLGQLDRYVDAVKQSRPILERKLSARLAGQTNLYLAVAALRVGKVPDAEAAAREAVTLLADTLPLRPTAEAVLALCLLARGDAGGALDLAARAGRELETSSVEEGESLIGLAEVEAHEACGDREAALAALRRACTRLEEHAVHLTDATLKEGFLKRVPENRALLERARGWCVVSPATASLSPSPVSGP